MPNCPVCKTPGAYVGFNTIECRNPRCVHFTIEEDDICPCCGKKGHTPGPEFFKRRVVRKQNPTSTPGANQPPSGND